MAESNQSQDSSEVLADDVENSFWDANNDKNINNSSCRPSVPISLIPAYETHAEIRETSIEQKRTSNTANQNLERLYMIIKHASNSSARF